MDIQKASNYVINKAVAESFGYVVKAQIGKYEFVLTEETDFLEDREFDYCSQWEDAGPIIYDNKIALTPPDELIVAWLASKDEYSSLNKNPLRAAMEVYLMMKEADRARRQA